VYSGPNSSKNYRIAGVDPSNYSWDCERVIRWGNAISNFIKRNSNVYLLTELPGNIGDHLIWAGTVDFLESHQIRVKEMSIFELSGSEPINGCLLIPGNGALTTYFHEWLPEIIESASKRFANVIVLPSQLEPKIAKIQKILKLSNVVFFAREVKSFTRTKDVTPIGLGVDLALFSQHFDQVKLSDHDSQNKSLLCLRTDAASQIVNAGFSPNVKINRDISVELPNLDSWIVAIREAELIVTDRLHVAVAGVMLNKKLFYIDPDDEKISSYFNFTFGSLTPTEDVFKVDLSWLNDKNYLKSRSAI
jgi:exopolysaccharide biosynthesis predicted pyruvyltransferase EpsI